MQNKDFFSGVPIEVREFLLRLLNLYIIFNISKYLTKMKVMTLQNHYNMNIIKYKVKYILYLKIFYRE